jgi:hypothetical protein
MKKNRVDVPGLILKLKWFLNDICICCKESPSKCMPTTCSIMAYKLAKYIEQRDKKILADERKKVLVEVREGIGKFKYYIDDYAIGYNAALKEINQILKEMEG